jgi:hypothetical protein
MIGVLAGFLQERVISVDNDVRDEKEIPMLLQTSWWLLHVEYARPLKEQLYRVTERFSSATRRTCD